MLSVFPSAVAGVLSEENVNITNSGVSEIINGTVTISAQDQPTTTVQCDTGGVQHNHTLRIFILM